jgi:hypothetical protein
MKTLGDQAQPELVNLQPLNQLKLDTAIPVAPADCADDAPC